MSGHHPIGDPHDLAALFAAGGMTADEAAAFTSHLESGCAGCIDALRQYEPVVRGMLDEVAPVAPRAALRARVLAAAAGPRPARPADEPPASQSQQVWKTWSADQAEEDIIIRAARESGWEETGVDGVQVRRLSVDRERNQMTALIRMAPGSAYPSHAHKGPEECLVLEGDLRAGDHRFVKGDYQRMAVGTHHGIQSTEGGCVLLIISSLSDEID